MSSPTDSFEREADQVAAAVVESWPSPRLSTSPLSAILARCPGGCGPVSCHPSGSADSARRDPVEGVLGEPGVALPGPLLQRMDAGLDADLSSVRLHDGPVAHRAARSVQARAFTMGNHVVFGANEYQPGSARGDWLLAHELTHVVQQTGARPGPSEPRAGRSRAPTGLYRAVTTACLAPSEVPSVTSNQASTLGRILELPIMLNYCASTGCAIFATDYLDTDAATYIAFLAAHNPHLTALDIVELAIAATVTGGVFRPDILTHKPPRFEYEEIKPDSVAGRAAGRAKQLGLAVLFARFSLPYLPGITWSGTGTLPLVTLPGPVEVFLEWHRNRPGLVVYNICVRGEEAVLLAYGIVGIILAVIAIILSRGGVLGGGPAPVPVLAALHGPERARPGAGGEQAPGGVSTEAASTTAIA